MDNNPTSVVAAGSTGALAFTGSNVIWLILAGFAMIATGTALARIVPRRER
jgi:branched-subunit amino acid transport protein